MLLEIIIKSFSISEDNEMFNRIITTALFIICGKNLFTLWFLLIIKLNISWHICFWVYNTYTLSLSVTPQFDLYIYIDNLINIESFRRASSVENSPKLYSYFLVDLWKSYSYFLYFPKNWIHYFEFDIF